MKARYCDSGVNTHDWDGWSVVLLHCVVCRLEIRRKTLQVFTTTFAQGPDQPKAKVDLERGDIIAGKPQGVSEGQMSLVHK